MKKSELTKLIESEVKKFLNEENTEISQYANYIQEVADKITSNVKILYDASNTLKQDWSLRYWSRELKNGIAALKNIENLCSSTNKELSKILPPEAVLTVNDELLNKIYPTKLRLKWDGKKTFTISRNENRPDWTEEVKNRLKFKGDGPFNYKSFTVIFK